MIRAFMAGVEAEMREIRGRGLTPAEREEFEELARRDAEISLEPVA
jgi:plasmid stability protein